MKHTAFIGLGSNLSNPSAQVLQAMQAIDRLPDTRVVARSSLYRSAPVGYLDQPDFINAVVKIETGLAPLALLQALLAVEQENGRTREFQNAPRTLIWICCQRRHPASPAWINFAASAMHKRALYCSLLRLRQIA
jgi:2-amino-4-hydroxy-6-hydroxymethyldihydropteridine diphosphokinase